MADPIRQDIELPYWTFETAALHVGISRKTVVRYVREGLPAYFGGKFVKPTEFVAEYQTRKKRQEDAKTRAQQP